MTVSTNKYWIHLNELLFFHSESYHPHFRDPSFPRLQCEWSETLVNLSTGVNHLFSTWSRLRTFAILLLTPVYSCYFIWEARIRLKVSVFQSLIARFLLGILFSFSCNILPHVCGLCNCCGFQPFLSSPYIRTLVFVYRNLQLILTGTGNRYDVGFELSRGTVS